MSIFKRILGQSPTEPATPATGEQETASEQPERPDPAARAREEEAAVAHAIAAGDMAEVGRWVLEGSTTGVRQLAAHAVTDPDQLHELIRATRHGKDKSVYRILTGTRDAQLAEQRKAEQLQADLDAAVAAITAHCDRPCDATSAATLGLLEGRWHLLAEQAPADLRSDMDQRLATARDALERYRAAQAAEAEQQRAAELAAVEAQRQQELEAQAAQVAADEQAQAAEAEREAAQAAEREAEKTRRQAEHAEVRHLVGLLRQAQAALERGGTARAEKLREEITAKLSTAPPALPVWYAKQLQQVDEKITELKDWKTFRVAPKRAELVERMQSLVGAEMSPEELARQIRRLRDEWRTLHRGLGEEPTPEREQFDAAAEKAYEPCRAHFAKQADQRHENQARREALLERLAAFAARQADESPDYRLIQTALVESRQEWQQYAPVDQSVAKELQSRFRALQDELHGRLKAEYDRNIEAKRALISRAAELVGLEDIRQAMDGAKRLQQEWKTIGLVPHKIGNALWADFRKHCDAVFQRTAQAAAAHAAARDAGQARAVALCEEVERIAALDDTTLPPELGQLATLREEFDSLELPRGAARDLRRRFEQASRLCNDALRRHRAAQARRGWHEAFAAAAPLRAYASAAARGMPADELETLRATAISAIEGLEHAPKPARAALGAQLARIADGKISTDLLANEAALRMLCVRAELAAGLETPPEDLERRREYQMQRLVASMTRGEHASPADLDELAVEWLSVGPVEPAVHDTLFARFEQCRKAER